MTREELRATFEEVPELYDQARPAYPREVFDDLAALTELQPGDRVLEIGPGTGKATRPLAERGLHVVGVELGEGLATVARRQLADLPDVEIVQADFEEWEPARAGFDAVVAFTAFHWIDPDMRLEKAARLLENGGALAVVQTNHVLPDGGDAFWVDVQSDYDEVVPSPDNGPPEPPEQIRGATAEIAASGLFEPVSERRYVWDVTYTADEYIAVLDTYSGHRSMAVDLRDELYRRIRRRIQGEPEGRVRKTYLAILHVARKR